MRSRNLLSSFGISRGKRVLKRLLGFARRGRRGVIARSVPSANFFENLQSRSQSLPDTLPNGQPWPKISIVTPSFNQGGYIEETIQSVILQGYPNVEHIVVDGGSTDETIAVLDRYRDRLAYVISEPDRGQSDALNKGFRRATGDILCWLNSDDQFAPGALAAVALSFATNDVDVVSGICEVYEDGKLVHRHMTACADGVLPLDDLLDLDCGWNAGQFFYQPEVFFTREIWVKAGAQVREDYYYSMDYELWCRLARVGARLHVIGMPLAFFRSHPDQKTADPGKFKKELREVRDQFVRSNDINLLVSQRKTVDFGRRLRIALVNDHGFKYGAGIAHARLAAGIEMAGHELMSIDLASRVDKAGMVDEMRVVADVAEFAPNVVLFGNLHSAVRDSVRTIELLASSYPCFWVTHDFWLFTGRCAYWGNCDMFARGCDATCPTASHYPDLQPSKIHDAWRTKRELLQKKNSLIILANSSWSYDVASGEMARLKLDVTSRVRKIRLGAPVEVFKPVDKAAARTVLDIKKHHFVIAFSVSSLGEERKGGQFLIDALSGLGRRDITVLVIGNLDVKFDIPGAEIVSLGYVNDNALLNIALNAADVYVGPSTEETFGQVFIEAALSGTPSIGFNVTGVPDAIRDGVTGILVQPSAVNLRNAVTKLYDDRALCEKLGRWARIYAESEYSIEASYRSLFVAFRECGTVDNIGVPHKIGFASRASAFGSTVISNWRPLSGVSPEEGPYPQFGLPFTFRWCHGERSRFAINSAAQCEALCIRLIYNNSLFDVLPILLIFNGSLIGEFDLNRTAAEKGGVLEFSVFANEGVNYLEIQPRLFNAPSEVEPRALSFMLREIELA